MDDRDTRRHTGNVTPEELADPSRHQQAQIFGGETRPQGTGPGAADRQEAVEAGEDIAGAGNRTVGDSAGPDTTGAVAYPAGMNRPGLATKLGGTPGANAMGSGGRRDTDY